MKRYNYYSNKINRYIWTVNSHDQKVSCVFKALTGVVIFLAIVLHEAKIGYSFIGRMCGDFLGNRFWTFEIIDEHFACAPATMERDFLGTDAESLLAGAARRLATGVTDEDS